MISLLALTAELPAGATLRPLTVDDAPALLEAYLRNRAHLQTFDPVRPESFYTLEDQQFRLAEMVRRMTAGAQLNCAIVRDGRILGIANLSTIVRGALCSASVGYWVDAEELRQGLATGVVAAFCRIADQELGLHRLDASVSPLNTASQGVLAKSGFEQYGLATNYLYINGAWMDSILFQRILNHRPPTLY
jgi:ribosomal-protein-alanine N-acetyltransferase